MFPLGSTTAVHILSSWDSQQTHTTGYTTSIFGENNSLKTTIHPISTSVKRLNVFPAKKRVWKFFDLQWNGAHLESRRPFGSAESPCFRCRPGRCSSARRHRAPETPRAPRKCCECIDSATLDNLGRTNEIKILILVSIESFNGINCFHFKWINYSRIRRTKRYRAPFRFELWRARRMRSAATMLE